MWKYKEFIDSNNVNLEKEMTNFLNKEKAKDFKVIKNVNNVLITIIYK